MPRSLTRVVALVTDKRVRKVAIRGRLGIERAIASAAPLPQQVISRGSTATRPWFPSGGIPGLHHVTARWGGLDCPRRRGHTTPLSSTRLRFLS